MKISRQKETYKTPYDRYPKDRPRHCVFVGTSNRVRFLPLDRTGNRRFYPIQTDASKAETHVLSDEAETRAYVDQLWAEAMVIYNNGEWSLRLSPALEKEMNIRRLDFMAEDTATGMVQAWLGRKPSAFCKEILGMSDVKTYDFVLDYFRDPAVLVASIKKYHEVSKIQRGRVYVVGFVKMRLRRYIISCRCLRVGRMIAPT